MKHSLFAVMGAFAAAAAIADPTVTGVTWSEDASGAVTIGYTLTGGPAVITLDIVTNVSDDAWASIGGEHIQKFSADSAVWKKVSGDGAKSITWYPSWSWRGGKSGAIRAEVTAWPLDNPPNYMVVDIAASAKPNTQRYYPEADFVPGGVLGDTRYRQTAFLMRKVLAKDIKWTMGSSTDSPTEFGRTPGNEAPHFVTLTNNYYMGVFPVTVSQWAIACPSGSKQYPSYFTNYRVRGMCPVEQVSYNEIRTSGVQATFDATHEFPNPPATASYLGILRTRSGIDFDLPGEAQWEFACRAGHGDGYWGTGKKYEYTGSTVSAVAQTNCRQAYYGGKVNDGKNNFSDPPTTCGPEYGTAICGSFEPNSWGIYDMHGNVSELCLDWYAATVDLDYRVNINPENPANLLSSPGTAGSGKVKRGGDWHYAPNQCRSAYRNSDGVKTQWYANGFRVMCPVEVP